MEPNNTQRERRRRGLVIAVAGAGVVALLAGRVPLQTWTSRSLQERRVEALIAAASELPYRSFEGRLSREVRHRPLRMVQRSGAEAPMSSALLEAAERVEKSPSHTPADAASLAAAELLTGKEGRAVDRLEAALLGPRPGRSAAEEIEKATDAALLTDLAAAYLARARSAARGAADPLLAAASAARAHALSPESAAASWNRALALEGLGLAPEARKAWRDYLALDGTSPWSEEGRGHLQALNWKGAAEAWQAGLAALEGALMRGDAPAVAAVAGRFPVRTEQLLERRSIPRWAELRVGGDVAANALLSGIGAAGRAIADSAHDQQIAAWWKAANEASDPRAFAQAHARVAEAHQALADRGTLNAVALLRVALTDLQRAGSPFAPTVAVEIGGLLYHAGNHVDALRQLDEADRMFDGRSWTLLAARSSWNRAVALTSLGQIGRATASYARTIELYRQTSDDTQLGMLEMLVGHNAEYAANLDSTWPHYVEGLVLAERHGDPDRVVVILDTFSRAALRNGFPGTAALLNDAMLERVQAPPFAPYRCHALITRCEIAARAGKRSEAAAQCSAARQIWSSIADAAVRDRLEADLDLATAAAAEPRARIDSLTRAVNLSEQRQDLYRLSRVLLQRGRTYVEVGAPQLARADFEQAMTAIEQERQRLETVPDRLTYFETSRAVAQELVRLLVRGGQASAALRVVDRVRARLLLERMAGTPAQGLETGDGWGAHLEPGRALIEYWADDSELFAWVIRREGVTLARVPVARATLEEAAQRFVAALGSDRASPEATDTDGQLLHRLLIAPLASALAGTDTLTIVPDERFADVPFAALRAPGGRYLLEELTLTRAPSLAAFTAAHALAPRRDSVLVVADPTTSEGLAPLDVRREVRSALRAAPRSLLLEGDRATPAAVRAAAGGFDILHIAAHGFDEKRFGEPALVLTGGSQDDGLLSASEVEEGVTLRKGALVVLAACRTGRGRRSSDGTMSMARAFAAAGAGSVIASLWDAGDRESGQIFTAFYAAVARGIAPAVALRGAQRNLILSDPRIPPQRWAAFQIYGGA